MNNEFYCDMRRADFKDVEKKAEKFIAQRMKIVLMPYLQECGKEVLFEEPDSCFSYILRYFNGFQSHLNEKMLQDYGCIGQPLGMINLILDLFKGSVSLQKEKKASADKKLEDYLQDEYDKTSQNGSWKQMQMLTILLEEYESLHKKRDIQKKFKMSEDILTIHSFTELLLVQIERFLNAIPKINVAICKNCGQIFVGEHGKREYCPYLFDEEKFCSDVGKYETRKSSKEKYPGLKYFDTVYDRMQKRIRRAEKYQNQKNKKKRQSEFNEWIQYAEKMKNRYMNDDITNEQFQDAITQKFQEVTGENI